MKYLLKFLKGGPGSGHYDHPGRPGEVGGSAPSSGGGGKGSKGKGKGKAPRAGGKKTGDGGSSKKHAKANVKEAVAEIGRGKEALAEAKPGQRGFDQRMRNARGRFTGAAMQVEDAIANMPEDLQNKYEQKLLNAERKARPGNIAGPRESVEHQQKVRLTSAFRDLESLAVKILRDAKSVVD